jgi:hypothetical protein
MVFVPPLRVADAEHELCSNDLYAFPLTRWRYAQDAVHIFVYNRAIHGYWNKPGQRRSGRVSLPVRSVLFQRLHRYRCRPVIIQYQPCCRWNPDTVFQFELFLFLPEYGVCGKYGVHFDNFGSDAVERGIPSAIAVCAEVYHRLLSRSKRCITQNMFSALSRDSGVIVPIRNYCLK